MVVVDSNILAYLLIDGERTAQARTLFERDSDWRSDTFLLAEFTNILVTYVRARRMQPEHAADLMANAEFIMRKGQHFVPFADALQTAIQYSVSGYDARFLRVARVMGTKLVTEDGKLRAAAPELTLSLAEALA